MATAMVAMITVPALDDFLTLGGLPAIVRSGKRVVIKRS
jgi:hypothetical protein